MFCFGIDSFRVFGNSSGILNWDNGTHRLNKSLLNYWCDRITLLKSYFSKLSIDHTFRENNDVADALSKEALDGDVGILHWEEWVERALTLSGSVPFFSDII